MNTTMRRRGAKHGVTADMLENDSLALFGRAVEHWRASRVSPHTVKARADWFKRLLFFLQEGEVSLRELAPSDLQAFLDFYEKDRRRPDEKGNLVGQSPVSPATSLVLRRAVNEALDYLELEGVLPVPAASLHVPRGRSGGVVWKPRILGIGAREQIGQAVARGTGGREDFALHMRLAMIGLLAETGLAPQDLVRLKKKNLIWNKDRVIAVQPDQCGRIALGADGSDYLTAWMDYRARIEAGGPKEWDRLGLGEKRVRSPYLFPGERVQQHISYRTLHHHIRRFGRLCEVEGLTASRLRSTTLRQMVRRHADLGATHGLNAVTVGFYARGLENNQARGINRRGPSRSRAEQFNLPLGDPRGKARFTELFPGWRPQTEAAARN